MAVSNFYRRERPNMGPPIGGAILKSYFDTIKGMNDGAMAYAMQDGDEEGDLDKMEIAARERMGKLAETLADIRSGDSRSYDDLMQTLMQTMSAEKMKAGELSTRMAESARDLYVNERQYSTKEADSLIKRIEPAEELAGYIDGLPETVRGADYQSAGNVDRIVTTLRQQLRAEGKDDPTSAEYSYAVGQAYTALKRGGANGEAIADLVAKEMLPAAVAAGQTPPEWFEANHLPPTIKAAEEQARRIANQYRGGMSAGGGALGALDAAGVNPLDVGAAGGTEERTRTRGAGGGERAPIGRVGGEIRASGLSPDALRKLADSDDPYAALQAAIDAQATYIDDLSARRKAAGAKSRPALYPRPNVYTVSPNRYVPDDWQRALRGIGSDDPAVNERALRDEVPDGLVEPRYAGRDWQGFMVEDGGDIGAIMAGALGAVEADDPDGKYRYRFEPNGDITIVKSPKSREPTTLRKGAPGYDAIAALRPADTFAAMLAAQPPEVRRLFREAELLAETDMDAAKAAAEAVTADEVRGAYGAAMARAARNPAAVQEVLAGLTALPDDAMGAAGDAFRESLDRYAADRPKAGDRADMALRQDLTGLGGALTRAGGEATKRKGRDTAERKEAEADFAQRSDYQHGREMGLTMVRDTKDDAALSAAWDGLHAAKGDLAAGAIEGFETAMAGRGDTIIKQRTGRLPMEMKGAPPVDTVGIGGDVSAKDWKGQRDDVDAAEFDTFTVPDTDGDEFDAFKE